MMTKHKHCDVIIAWANGAKVQYEYGGIWQNVGNPSFDEGTTFRASLAIVEGKPVFEGDVLYFDGLKFEVNEHFFKNYPHSGMSWLPPKPKTITVTIQRPKEVTWAGGFVKLYYEENENTHPILETIKEAMK